MLFSFLFQLSICNLITLQEYEKRDQENKQGSGQKYYPPSLFLLNLYHSTQAPFGVSNVSSLEARWGMSRTSEGTSQNSQRQNNVCKRIEGT